MAVPGWVGSRGTGALGDGRASRRPWHVAFRSSASRLGCHSKSIRPVAASRPARADRAAARPRVAARHALADLVDRSGSRRPAGPLGELECPDAVHAARVDLLSAGDGGRLAAGGRQADQSGVGQRLQPAGARTARSVSSTRRRRQRVFGRQGIGLAAQADRVVGQLLADRDDDSAARSSASACDDLDAELTTLGRGGRPAGDRPVTRSTSTAARVTPGQAGAAWLVLDRAAGQQDRSGQLSTVITPPPLLSNSSDVGPQPGDRRISLPPLLGCSGQLAHAGPGHAQMARHVGLAGPGVGQIGIEPEEGRTGTWSLCVVPAPRDAPR